MMRSTLAWLSLGLTATLLGWLFWPSSLPALAPVLVEAPLPQPEEELDEGLPAPSSLRPPVELPASEPATPPSEPSQALAEQPETAAPVDAPCDPSAPLSLPRSGEPGASQFWQEFRQPLPPAPLWSPPGPRRVGLQAGHWRLEEAPPELSRLQHGAVGGGKQEWEVNLDLAERTRALLEEAGVQVDVLPATVPQRYRAHVFVAIHADGDPAGQARGFKVARPAFSSVPEADDRLVEALNLAYAGATGLPRDDQHITRRMLYYYAFNSRRYCHAVAPGVPQAIIETGFLTSPLDRQLLLGDPDPAARGIAQGLLAFLNGGPAPPLP